MQKYKQGLELWNFQLRQAGETGHLAKLIHANTVDRTYTLPDKDGTFAMLSDISSSGVTTFNTRSGVVTLTSADVTTALGYTPFNKAGDTVTSTITSTITSKVPVLESANTTTYGKVIRLKNTGGELRVGVEASVAGTDFASDSPYDSCWYSPSNTSIFKTPLAFFTGNVQVAASGSFQGPGTGLTGTAASLTAGAATTASRMMVGDVRSTTPTPDSYDGSRITAEFNNDALLDLTGWNSKITVAGWQAGYNVWQMAGGSSSAVSPSRWFLRDGNASTWNAWKEIWHSGNLNIYDWAKAAHLHTNLKSVDDRDRKPTDTAKGYLEAVFTSLEGMTGSAGADYHDLLVMNTYTDTSGGMVNALAFDKSQQIIRYYQAAQGATTWGTPVELIHSGNISTQAVASATIANGLTTAASIQGGTGWSSLTLNTTGGSWDIAQCNANYNVLEFRPAGGDTGKIVFYRNGSISAQGMLQGPAVSLGATDGSGINFWGSGSSYTTYMSATSNSTYGGGWDATNADYNMYFRMTSNKRGFVFQNPSTHSETGTFKNGTIAHIKPQGIGGMLILKDTTTAGKAYGFYFAGGVPYMVEVS